MQIGLDKFVKEEAAIVPLAAVVRKSDAGGTQTRIRVTWGHRTRLIAAEAAIAGMNAENL